MAAKSTNTAKKKAWYLGPYLLGLTISLFAAIYYLLAPINKNEFLSWNPGQLHSSHQFMNNNCQACHQNSFEKVQDSSCTQCHKMEDHADKDGSMQLAHRRIKSEGACIDCHLEHSGHAALIQSENRLCVDCHAELSAAVKDPIYKNVDSLFNHPKFSVPVKTADKMNRQEIGNGARDQNTLKLNHALHLKKDLRGPDGPVQMQCSDCHVFNKQSGNLSVSINFDKNCRSCHQLTFDESMPDSVVPHGNEDLILPHLLTAYSRQQGLKNINQLEQKIESLRKIPGKTISDLNMDPAFVKILSQARAAEEVLFTKTSCNLCHQVSTNESSPESLQSRYKITKPQIPQPWLSKADFPHSSHEIVNCESCHSGVHKSEKTSDILLPQIDNCQQCHKDAGSTQQNGVQKSSNIHAQIESDCISCHNYHDQQQLSDTQKKELAPLVQQMIRGRESSN